MANSIFAELLSKTLQRSYVAANDRQLYLGSQDFFPFL
jgi:hypothetical protein